MLPDAGRPGRIDAAGDQVNADGGRGRRGEALAKDVLGPQKVTGGLGARLGLVVEASGCRLPVALLALPARLLVVLFAVVERATGRGPASA